MKSPQINPEIRNYLNYPNIIKYTSQKNIFINPQESDEYTHNLMSVLLQKELLIILQFLFKRNKEKDKFQKRYIKNRDIKE